MLWDSLKRGMYQKPHLVRREDIFWDTFWYPQEVNKTGCLCLSADIQPLISVVSVALKGILYLHNEDQGYEFKGLILPWFSLVLLLILIESQENSFSKCLVCLYPLVNLGGSSQYRFCHPMKQRCPISTFLLISSVAFTFYFPFNYCSFTPERMRKRMQ